LIIATQFALDVALGADAAVAELPPPDDEPAAADVAPASAIEMIATTKTTVRPCHGRPE
jgi:hypothetical protein